MLNEVAHGRGRGGGLLEEHLNVAKHRKVFEDVVEARLTCGGGVSKDGKELAALLDGRRKPARALVLRDHDLCGKMLALFPAALDEDRGDGLFERLRVAGKVFGGLCAEEREATRTARVCGRDALFACDRAATVEDSDRVSAEAAVRTLLPSVHPCLSSFLPLAAALAAALAAGLFPLFCCFLAARVRTACACSCCGKWEAAWLCCLVVLRLGCGFVCVCAGDAAETARAVLLHASAIHERALALGEKSQIY